jgi:hypothetical protein
MRLRQAINKLVSKRPSPAMTIALIALFLSLAGNGLALEGKFTIDGNDLQRGAVHRYAIHRNAVSSVKLADHAVHASDVGNVVLASNVLGIPAGTKDMVTASCPDGTRMLSGGAASSDLGRPITATLPSGPNSWTGALRNNSDSNVNLTVYVLCLK